MIKLIIALNRLGEKDLIKKIVKAVAGRYYNKVGKGKDILYLNALSPSQVVYIISKNNNTYNIVSLKKNTLFGGDYIEDFLKEVKSADKVMNTVVSKAKKNGVLKFFKKNLSLDELLSIVVNKESFHENVLYKWFPEIRKKQKEKVVKIGNFDVLLGDLPKDYLPSIQFTLDKSTKMLKDINLSKIAYGDVILVDKLPGKTSAIYSQDTDIIKMLKDTVFIKNWQQPVHDMLHELAHRAYRKNYVDKKTIDDKYMEVYSGWKKDDIELQKWVPSLFSVQKNNKSWATEWFSELVAYALLDRNKMYKDFIKEVIK